MCRGFRPYVSLLVSVCFILSMLSLNTLQVKAAYSSGSSTISGTVASDTVQWSSSGVISAQSGGAITPHASYWNSSGSYHFEVPIILNKKHTDFGNSGTILPTDYYTYWGIISSASISGDANVENMYIRDTEGNVIFKQGDSNIYLPSKTARVDSIFYADRTKGTNITYYVCGDAWFTDKDQIPVQIGDYGAILSKTFSITVNWSLNGRLATSAEIENAKLQVSDSGTNQKLDTLNDSTEAIEESVTSDTGGGILATIKNFFGSFFQNVFDTLVSVFVPEDGFFSDWFNRLNTLLSEKLGMLYAPFDLLITTLTAIMNADTTDTGIPFPGIQWEDTWLVEPFTFYFSSLGDTFTDLQGYVYFATDTVLLFAFLYLLQNKIRLILEGHESG